MPFIFIAGASARAAAFSAHAAGFEVATADMFADADLREIASSTVVSRYPYGLVEAMKQLPQVPWMYTGAVENYPRLVDHLANLRPLLGICGMPLRKVRDPLLVAKTLREAELPSAACRTWNDPPEPNGTWLLKPRRSAGGFDIHRWKGTSPPETNGHYFQAMIEGRPIAAVFLGNAQHAVLLGVTEQLTAAAWAHAGPFQYTGSFGPLALAESTIAQCRRIGETLSQRFALTGLFGVDAILSGDTIVPVEINPRFPASVEILERAHQWSAVALHVQACVAGKLPKDETLSSNSYPSGCIGKAILYAPHNLTIDTAKHQQLMERRGERLRPLLADIPVAGSEIPLHRPVLTIFAESTSPAEVAANLKSQAASIYRLLK